MPPFPALRNIVASLLATLVRRLFRRPTRPSWPFGYEVVVGALRRNARWTAGRPLAVARDFQERLARTQKPISGVRRERAVLAGVPAEIHRVGPHEVTLLYLHGGAHVAGSPTTHAELISRLTRAGGFTSVAIDFRLAPEHSVDDAVEDVLAVHRSLLDDGRRVVWAGDSSGGALAYLAAITARERGVALPERIAALSPWVDLRCEADSYERFHGVDWGTREALVELAMLASRGRPLDDPGLSPIAADLRGMPPSLIHAGGAEIVQDDVVAFADALRAAGNVVTLRVWPDQVHAFQLLAAFHPEAEAAVEDLAAFLRG